MRYFLNIRTTDGLSPDPEGDEFSDADQLFEHAKQVVEELEQEFPSDAKDARIVLIALEVMDETGAMIFNLPVNPGSTR